jgi:hypothetical protein
MSEPVIKVSLFGKDLSADKSGSKLTSFGLFALYLYATGLSCFTATLAAKELHRLFPVLNETLLVLAGILGVLGFLRDIRFTRERVSFHIRNNPIATNLEAALCFFAFWHLSSSWSALAIIVVYLPLFGALMLSMARRSL